MIRQIEALRYRCLQYAKQRIDPFQIFVGPNGSGKSTFLDTVRFLGQLVSEGLEASIVEGGKNFHDLLWQRQGRNFELAIEIQIPEDRKKLLPSRNYETSRYEISVGVDSKTGENAIFVETLLLGPQAEQGITERELFPQSYTPQNTILLGTRSRRYKTIINKKEGGNDNFYDETGKGWAPAFKLGPQKSALANLPDDETKFPVATWVKRTLCEGIETIVLNSGSMRKPSPPGQPRWFRPDGSNLPWVCENLRRKNESRFHEWIAHVRTALPDLKTIETIERPDDRHRYIQVVYRDNLKVPSWCISDGTLRLLALTLLAYAGESEKVFLIEEPENGIHPQAVETVFQSLSSAYGCQILCASHSPVVLSLAEPKQILCFAKTEEGATDIVRGDEHPKLRDWKKDADLGTLFATGVLG